MNRKLILRGLIVLAAGGAVLAAAWGGLYLTQQDAGPQIISKSPADGAFPEPGTVPIGGPFTLVDHQGRTVTEQDFGNRYLLVFFGFSHCPDICPTTLADIAGTLEMLGDDADAVQPLFISLDPERDTPERLAEYVAAFDPRIVGLTGTPEQIAAVAGEYRTFYEKIASEQYFDENSKGGNTEDAEAIKKPLEEDYMISHQGNTYLMSPDSGYLAHFSYGTRPEAMAETIRAAIAEFGRPASVAQ
jgi:protein SCO1/2